MSPEFPYSGDVSSGTGIFIFEGDRVYSAVSAMRKPPFRNGPSGNTAEIDGFMKSFKLTAKR